MTSQTLTTDRSANSSTAVLDRPIATTGKAVQADRQSRVLEAMKAQYRIDQQVKFLHLQAEADTLFQQLQVMKQQRQASGFGDTAN
ncbi:hypothetical protein ACN4EK_11940 [Pantanalinema rosaneae CENA516]|uniref:hypothetical protein n=1 Tax=Pantanalinema rosaneae TaxID=1620701 RepID=UPI003D6FBCBF